MGYPFRGMSRGRRRLTIGVAVVALLALPVSMVFASHTFSDVSTSAFYHDDVDAIANAGITAGCGGTKYCPNNAVTRGQMAVFLNKLGALGDGTIPVVDALSVGGVLPVFGSTTLAVTGTPTAFCSAALPTFTGTDVFIADVQLFDPATGNIQDYQTWADYAGVGADEFKVCIADEDDAALTDGNYEVQISTLEFIGQGLFASGAGKAQANRARPAWVHKD